MKIEIRVAWVLRYIGSSTTCTSTILPSAGAITYCSPRGPERDGSRKKTRSHTASRNRTTSGTHTQGDQHPPGKDEGPPFGGEPHPSSRGRPVIRLYASKYRSLVACTTSRGSGGGGALPSHWPSCFRPAR